MNQIELHPYFPQVEALAQLHEQGIIVQAWSQLGRGEELLAEPVIGEIAAAKQASPAQIVLAWHRHRGIVAIPKSSSPQRQQQNLASVDLALDDAEVDAITALGSAKGRLWDGDPARHEEL